ncbi:MAG: MFS transporter [Dehalococcoidia bacterium]|nr:MFS transporter [Dehalococcoidia bacterium]
MPEASVPPPEDAPTSVGIRTLLVSVYLPTLFFAIGQGAVIPAISLRAVDDLGTTAAFAALAVGLRGIGTMVFDVPAGVLIGRIGERYALLAASLVLVGVAAVVAFSSSLLVYAAAILVMGCALSIWLLARLSYISEKVSVERRGRALSLMGGTQRAGNVIGPLLGGIIGGAMGQEYVFWFFGALAMAGSAVMLVSLRPGAEASRSEGDSLYGRIATVVVDHRQIFVTAGLASICLQVMRAGRQAIIPLWGNHIGLGSAEIGLVFTLSSVFDVLLFYPVGIVMDRYGRKWTGVPSMVVLAVSMLLIPLTDTAWTMIAVGVLSGLGNGLGSGINMTLGADFAPPGNRGEFLGVWRLVGDIGTATGPLIVSGFTGLATLGIASVATGGIGIAGALVFALLVPEPLYYRATKRDPVRPSGP